MTLEETLAPTDLIDADVFRLLSACFYQPEKELLAEERVCENLAAAVNKIFPQATENARDLISALRASSEQELLIDYARLLVGPFEPLAYPYGSVYLDGQKVVMGDSTLAVKELYAEHGMELADDFHEMPDHIAVELEFLYLLCFRAQQARLADDAATLSKIKKTRRDFLTRHLGQWISTFAGKVQEQAQTDFYRLLASLCEQCVKAQMELDSR